MTCNCELHLLPPAQRMPRPQATEKVYLSILHREEKSIIKTCDFNMFKPINFTFGSR